MDRLTGLYSLQCIDKNRTKIVDGSTNFVCGSYQLVNECMHGNQNMMNDVAHAGLIARQMIIYYNVQNERAIEMKSIK